LASKGCAKPCFSQKHDDGNTTWSASSAYVSTAPNSARLCHQLNVSSAYWISLTAPNLSVPRSMSISSPTSNRSPSSSTMRASPDNKAPDSSNDAPAMISSG